ncbi:hypothetical protein TB1_001247 [Malus domestica]
MMLSDTPKSGCTSSKPSHISSLSTMKKTLKTLSIVTNWEPNSSRYTKPTSIFQSSRKEAKQLLKSVKNLHCATHVLVRKGSPSGNLVLAQNLMPTAMKRLGREFYETFDHLDPESGRAPLLQLGRCEYELDV